MAKVLNNSLMVCSDCYIGVGIGDYSSFDYYYSPEQATKQIQKIENAIMDVMAEYNGGFIYPGESDEDLEFSKSRCECCKSHLAGSRHHCIVLGR